jgi:hypothetical protein
MNHICQSRQPDYERYLSERSFLHILSRRVGLGPPLIHTAGTKDTDICFLLHCTCESLLSSLWSLFRSHRPISSRIPLLSLKLLNNETPQCQSYRGDGYVAAGTAVGLNSALRGPVRSYFPVTITI